MMNVMNVTGLKFLASEAKKLATGAIDILKRLVAACFRIQFNLAVFPFIFVYGGIVYVSKWFLDSDSEDSTLQPPSAVVCRKTKELRDLAMSSMIAMNSYKCHNEKVSREDQNKRKYEKPLDIPHLNVEDRFSVGSSGRNSNVASIELNKFSGRDLMWDVPIISAKAKYFAQCVKEEKTDMVEARKALEEHPLETAMPETRQVYEDMKHKAGNKPDYLESSIVKLSCAETRNADNSNANESADSFEKYSPHDELCRFIPKRKTKCLNTQDKRCHEISIVNKTLRKMHGTCSKLLGEISNLNEALNKVISMKEKLANLESQVVEGKRLLQEVECDRSVMKSKLSALEKLINEEEKFLSDVCCESGFYENVETTGEILT